MIETERLVLRPWRDADKDAFAGIINTPAMMRYFGGVAARDKIDAIIDRQIASQRRDGLSMWAVDTREGALAGICGLRAHRGYAGTPVDNELEIGWRIAERYWGQGMAREAARASLEWGWRHRDEPRIAAWVHPDNARSWGLMHRLGMERRPELDFHHPQFAPDDPVGECIVYTIARPA